MENSTNLERGWLDLPVTPGRALSVSVEVDGGSDPRDPSIRMTLEGHDPRWRTDMGPVTAFMTIEETRMLCAMLQAELARQERLAASADADLAAVADEPPAPGGGL